MKHFVIFTQKFSQVHKIKSFIDNQKQIIQKKSRVVNKKNYIYLIKTPDVMKIFLSKTKRKNVKETK